MAAQKPTIFFVHGAWHQTAHFEPLIARLSAAGYPAVCPTQPTFDRSGADLVNLTLHDDAAFIRSQLAQLIETENRSVIAVLHSYGGVVGTQAIDASLSQASRAAEGKKGGILRLVYMAAFMLPPSASLGDAFGGKLPDFIGTLPDGSCVMLDWRDRFYSEMSDEEAAKWLALLKPHVAQAQLTRLTYTAYLHHPLAYVVSTRDRALLPDLQRKMVEGAKGNGLAVDVYEVAGDHSPYLSKVEEMAQIIEKIAEQDSKADAVVAAAAAAAAANGA